MELGECGGGEVLGGIGEGKQWSEYSPWKKMFRLKEDKEKWEPKLIHVFLEIIVSVKDSKTSTSYRVEIDTYDALKSLNGKN